MVGEVGPAHGIKGEVVVRSFSDNPARFAAGTELMAGTNFTAAGPLLVENCRNKAGRTESRKIVKFAGVEDRSEAEALQGRLLFVAATDLGDLGDEEYWEHQLVGLPVLNRSGASLGIIQGILRRPSQDLWQVATEHAEVLVPAVKKFVISVDLAGGKVILDPPEGLFE